MCTLSSRVNVGLSRSSGMDGVIRLKDDNGRRAEKVESEVRGKRLGRRGMLSISVNTCTKLCWTNSEMENGNSNNDVRRGRLGTSFDSMGYLES